MELAIVAAVGAAVLARVRGGSWRGLVALDLAALRLLVVAVAAQLLAGALQRLTSADGFARAGALVSILAVLGFCWRNRRVAGIPLVATGLLVNGLVIVLNGAMPVSAAAAHRAGVSTARVDSGADPRHVMSGPGTRARLLGDTIAVPLPVRPEVVSPGDVLLAAGVGELIYVGMRPRRRRPTAPTADRPAAAAVALRENPPVASPAERRSSPWRKRAASVEPERSARQTTASAPTPRFTDQGSLTRVGPPTRVAGVATLPMHSGRSRAGRSAPATPGHGGSPPPTQ